LTEQLIVKYKAKIQKLTLVPSDGGRFELTIDGDLVYSKLQTGKFPEWAQLEPLVDAKSG